MDNKEEVEVNGSTVGECIDNVNKKYPDFKDQLIKDGRLRDLFEIYINNGSAYPDELLKPVKDGDTVSIITFVQGG